MATYNYLCKFIIVGDTCVGKSNILLQFTQKKFKLEHEITIGVEFAARNLSVDNKEFRIQIWDTAGQETFRSITKAYYKSSACAFIVYDITRKSSFDNLSIWYEDCKSQSPKTVVLILIGNKVDLEHRREVTYEQGSDFAKKYNMLFFETSALTNLNINEVFTASILEINKNLTNGLYDLSNDSSGIKPGNININNRESVVSRNSVSLNGRIHKEEKKSKCC